MPESTKRTDLGSHGTRPIAMMVKGLSWLSSVRLGLLLLLAIGLYTAAGTIPLGHAFEFLGGHPWSPGRTLRHLPWIDLRESEFYSTTLFSALLVVLIVNIALATLLRIKWQLRKVGVITTHCGVIVLAAGAYLATNDPIRATVTVWADRSSNIMLDSTRSVLWGDGVQVGDDLVGGLLPRYADFGVPWSDQADRLIVTNDVAVTGFAHSARMVDRLSEVRDSGNLGWEFTEHLRSGDSRRFAVLTSEGVSRGATLTDGTAIVTIGDGWGMSDFEASLDAEPRHGVLWIRVDPELPAVSLAAKPGATAATETPNGTWQAEFIERADSPFGFPAGIFRIEGPGRASSLGFTASWAPSDSGLLGEADDGGGIELLELPAGVEVLFADRQQDALLLSRNGWLLSRGAETRSGDPPATGEVLQLSDVTSLEVELAIVSASMIRTLERLPAVEDAQLLADPRLNSWIRVSSSDDLNSLGQWIAYDDTLSQPAKQRGFEFGPKPIILKDGSIRLKGFQAKLFRRGSIPQDFSVKLAVEKSGREVERTLRLNEPIRCGMTIDGRERSIQLSLIGWDSRGWDAARESGSTDRLEGVRFVILSVNSREGVGIAITGATIILLGGGVSMLLRSRSRSWRPETA